MNGSGEWPALVVLLALLLTGFASADKVRFDKYQVYRLRPTTQRQVDALRSMEDDPDGLSFWTGVSSHTNSTTDVMVAPHKTSQFVDFLRDLQIEHRVFIGDLQKMIDSEQPVSEDRVVEFSWDRYHRLDQMYAWLRSIASSYNAATVENIGKTFEGRDILGLKISYKSGNPGIFVEGGIHAREWISPAVTTYIINELLSSNDSQVRDIAENFDWYIFPCTNPDGYEYTHTTNRMWRKTRSRGRLLCHGADPNRNWGFHWRDGGASGSPCVETFAGSAAFSEVETRVLASYIASLSHDLKIYLSVHSYSQLLLTPFGVRGLRPRNAQTLMDIGIKTAESLARRYGTRYTVGNIVDVLYVASGSSVDWVVGDLGVPIAFIYELRDTGLHGFLLPADQIVDSGKETLDSFVTLVTESRKTF